MTLLSPFTTAMADIFAAMGAPVWLTHRSGGQTSVKAIIEVPGRGELAGEAPMSLDNRIIDLSATVSALTGDLITFAGVTYILGKSPSPDVLGLSKQWIGVPLTLSVGSIDYHSSGYPLVAWSGSAWTAI
jgi:hypothetical protein